jgi:G:T-mismatch repair DNA endonuclease (very short patch repair protein)
MFKLHVKNSHNSEFKNETELELFVLKTRFGLTDVLIGEIIKKYINDGSVFSLVKEYKIPNKSLTSLLKLNNIKLKSSKEISNQKSVRNKYKTTCFKRFGVDNVSNNESIKEKKQKTFIKNYGVDNIFKLDEFKDNVNELMLKKYGVKRISGWYSYTEEQKLNQIKRLCSGGSSILEKRVGKILIDIGLKFEPQFTLKGKVFDYYINNTNILIEVNGDFWHANPRKYKIGDILPFPKKHVLAETIWKKDEKKIDIAYKNQYKVITLWEMDISSLNDIELELFIVEQINLLK